jgi:hypothetical protein
VNGNGIFDSATDTTAVFTISVDPTAGTSGQYTFDLLQPLDGAVTSTPLGSGTSYGAGPSNSVIVSQLGTNLALVTGYQVTGAFSESNWKAGGTVPASALTNQTVNGSSAGWGVNNNNFTTGEFMRFDFGAVNDYDAGGVNPPPSTPAGYSAPEVSYATFDLVGYSASDRIVFVVHDSNGGSRSYDVTGAMASLTVTALSGNIAWIDTYAANAGSGKLDLQEIGTISTTVNSMFPVALTFTDGDGDTVTGSFNISVATSNAPSTASAMELEVDVTSLDFGGLASDAAQRTALASTGSAVMTAAVAAMGLVATEAAATGHEPLATGSSTPTSAGTLGGEEASMDASAVTGVSQSALGTVQNNGVVGQASNAIADSSVAPAQAALDAPASDDAVASSLLAPTETTTPDSFAASLVAPMIVMPSAESLIAIGQAEAAGGTQRAITVEKVLAETLEGGASGTDIDALLARLSNGGSDENPALGQLASQQGEGVPAWDMVPAGGLPDMHVVATAQDMAVFHHDAVQPAING